MKHNHVRTFLVFIASILLFGCGKSDGDTDEEVIHIMSVSLNETTLSILSGQTETLIATVRPQNATNKNVTWLSSNDKIATVSSTGVITAIKAGETKITVTTEDGKHTAICSVTVTEPTVSVSAITLNQSTLSILSGQTETLLATVAPENATNKSIIWASSNDKVVTVSSIGVITAIKAGEARITATTVDGAKKATCSVTVTDLTVSVSGVTLNKSALSILSGQTETLSATVAPTDATNKNVTWTSSNDKAATVSSTGVVTGVKAGVATITAITVDGAKEATCSVTVTDPIISVTGISLNKSTISIQSGKTETLIATVTPADATNKNITWASTDDKIAAVNSTGVVTAKSIGTVTITAATVDGAKKATCSVTVIEPIISVTGISLNKTTTSIQLGKGETLIATVAPANATNKNVTWASSDDKVATVSSTGAVTVKSIGTVTITVTTVDGRKTASCYIKVVSSGDLDDFNPGKL